MEATGRSTPRCWAFKAYTGGLFLGNKSGSAALPVRPKGDILLSPATMEGRLLKVKVWSVYLIKELPSERGL